MVWDGEGGGVGDSQFPNSFWNSSQNLTFLFLGQGLGVGDKCLLKSFVMILYLHEFWFPNTTGSSIH